MIYVGDTVEDSNGDRGVVTRIDKGELNPRKTRVWAVWETYGGQELYLYDYQVTRVATCPMERVT